MSQSNISFEHIQALGSGERLIETLDLFHGLEATNTAYTLNSLRHGIDGAEELLEPGTELFSRLPESAQIDAVGDPQVGSWARYCMNQGRHSIAYVLRDLRYYGSIAAGAAMTVRVPFDGLPLPQQPDGSVTVHGYGRILFDEPYSVGAAAIAQYEDDRLHVRLGREGLTLPHFTEQPEDPQWQSLRSLKGPLAGIVRFDDISPYRGLEFDSRYAVSERLTPEQFTALEVDFNEACSFLANHRPAYAAAMDRHLKTVVPFKENAHFIREADGPALGMVGLSAGHKAGRMVLSLVDGFQRGQVRTLHGLKPLLGELSRHESLYAPTADVPVDLRGFMDAAILHMAVVDIAHARLDARLPQNLRAEEIEYFRWVDRLRNLLNYFQDSSLVTETGKQLMESFRASHDEHRKTAGRTEQLFSDSRDIAHMLNLDHYICWRLRNKLPDSKLISRLADNYGAGLPCMSGEIVVSTQPESEIVYGNHVRERLLAKLTNDRRLSPTQADEYFAAGAYKAALEKYRECISSPDSSKQQRIEAWAGLALVYRWAEMPTSALLSSHPEVVRAVHETLRADQYIVDPVKLITWFGDQLGITEI